MMESWRKHVGSVRLLVMLLTIAVAIYILEETWQILGLFSDVVIALFSAWVISFILEPIVEKLRRFVRISKIASAAIVYTLFFGLLILTIMLLVPVVGEQIQHLGKVLPFYSKTFPKFFNQLTNNSWSYVQNSLPILPSVAQFLFMVFVVLIISFYLVIDKERLHLEVYNLIPKKWHEHLIFFEDLVNATFGSFLRVQLLFGIVAGIVTWIVLRVLNIDFAASTAVVSGFLTAIPFLGAVLGIIPPVFIAFLIDPTRALIVFLILLAMQQILFNIVGPKILGNALKLHPIVVLLSFILGYRLFGVIGAIFAVPVLGIIIVILHRLGRHFLSENK